MSQELVWERGRRVMSRWPAWLIVLVAPYYAWIEAIAHRPKLVLSASIVAFAFLAYLKFWMGPIEGSEQLDWGTVGLLSTGHIWVPLLMMTYMYPFYLAFLVAVWVLARVHDRTVRRRETNGPA